MAANSSSEHYSALGSKVWDKLTQMCSSNADWKASFAKDGVDVFRMDLEETDWHMKGKLFKAVGVIEECNIDDLISLVSDLPKRPMWDAQNEIYTVLSTVDSEVDVLHTGVKGMLGVSARDFTSVRKTIYDREKGVWTSAQVNCEHETPAEFKKKFVRGVVLPSGWTFERVNDTSTRVHYVAGVYLAGWLPQAAVNAAVENNTWKFFPMVRDLFADKEKYNNIFKQAQNKS